MAPPNRDDIGSSVFGYNPSKVAPIIMACAFLVPMCIHIEQLRRYRTWKITGALPWGCFLFVAGFAVREATVFNNHNLNLFIASQVLIIAAPPVFSLTNYMMLGRTLYYVPYLSPLHPGRVLTTFVGLDVLVEILTANGASKVANISSTPAQLNIGKGLLRASLLLQVALFALFMSLTVTLQLRCLRQRIMNHKLRTTFVLIYTSSTLILTRCIFRVLETWDIELQPSKYINEREAFFYIFDAVLMLANGIIFNIWHPYKYLPSNNKVFLAKDGQTEVEGPGWVEKRSWIASALDPFDLFGLFKGKDKETKWWEGDGVWARKARGEHVAEEELTIVGKDGAQQV